MAKGGGFDVVSVCPDKKAFCQTALLTETSSGKELSSPVKCFPQPLIVLTQQDESAVFVTPNVNKIITFNHINTGKELSMDFSIYLKTEGEMSRVERGGFYH